MQFLFLFVVFSGALHELNGARGGLRKPKAKEVKGGGGIPILNVGCLPNLPKLPQMYLERNERIWVLALLCILKGLMCLNCQDLSDVGSGGDDLECQNVSFVLNECAMR